MRALLALAAALLLSACQVDVEGAVCAVPGSGDLCPSGQRCGNDLRCSARAASCADRCTPGERGCVGGDVQTCVDSDPVCGAWSVEVDCAGGLVCRGAGPEAACACPANDGAEVVVDAGAGAAQGDPAPTGVRTPAGCRFATLAAGLAAARDGTVVVMAGPPATYPVTAPLALPPGVTLRGDDAPPAPALRVLSLEGDLAAGVTLAEGAALAGFTVRNGSAPATAVGVKVACGAGRAARLEDVVVEAAVGTSRLAQGIRAEGACPVALARVTATGASGPGLLVARDAADQTVVVTDSTLDGNGEGVRLTRGDLTLQRAVVKGSAGAGVVAAGADTRLVLEQSTVRANGDSGLLVQANAQRVRLLGSRICGNAAASPNCGFAGVTRRVGGICLNGRPPADLAFAGNAVHANAGDQLMVAGASETWNLDGAQAGATACGPGRNVFAGYLGTSGRGVFAMYASVIARWNGWQGISPAPGADYEAYPADSASVNAGTGANPPQVCAPPAPTELDCVD